MREVEAESGTVFRSGMALRRREGRARLTFEPGAIKASSSPSPHILMTFSATDLSLTKRQNDQSLAFGRESRDESTDRGKHYHSNWRLFAASCTPRIPQSQVLQKTGRCLNSSIFSITYSHQPAWPATLMDMGAFANHGGVLEDAEA